MHIYYIASYACTYDQGLIEFQYRLYSSNVGYVMQLKCIESDSHSAIYTIFMLGTVSAIINFSLWFEFV